MHEGIKSINSPDAFSLERVSVLEDIYKVSETSKELARSRSKVPVGSHARHHLPQGRDKPDAIARIQFEGAAHAKRTNDQSSGNSRDSPAPQHPDESRHYGERGGNPT